MKNSEILNAILESVDDNLALEDLYVFLRWIVTKSRRYAFSHYLPGMPGMDLRGPCDTCLKDLLGRPVKQIVPELFDSGDTLRISTGMSCLNSALPVPKGVFTGNAVDLFQAQARCLRTCFIGHFPDAERWREQGYPVDIIELFPQPGDIHWDRSQGNLAAAEIVFITGLTLVNGTFPEVIRRTPNARYRVLLGPTVPLSPILFDYGIHLVGSALILDRKKAIDYFRWGGGSFIFKQEGFVRRVCLTRTPELMMRRDGIRPAKREV